MRNVLFYSHRFLIPIVGALVVVGCKTTSTPTPGEFDPARGEYRPSRAQRACATDAECVAIETDCRESCPGGSALNKSFLANFTEAHHKACATLVQRKAKRTGERRGVCVAAPVKCEAGMCTWMYEGPDPSTL